MKLLTDSNEQPSISLVVGRFPRGSGLGGVVGVPGDR